MSKDTKPKHDELQKKHALEQHEVKQVLNFLKRYGTLIGAGIVAATVAVLASHALAANKAAKIAEAEQMLLSAQTPQQLEEVVNNYKSTPTAPVALLNLAKTLFNEGETAQARAQYERFVDDYKKSDQLPIAVFGLAYCSEAEGRFDEAASEFKTFLADNPGHYLESPAVLAMARCLEQAGRTNEARIVLEDFLAQNADSRWAGAAEVSLQQLGK
ncbi:MAG: tetratricopeptide repeat protein [Kiritimatiellales bacterium]|nr:tetratricopeptide repeat protein [Kiritimatiellota bacterium]MBL7011660.1 tetratricopeptide repeat protein [Kiritimatiellales bacterium]